MKSDRPMKYAEILDRLRSLSNPKAVHGMARYGINPENAFGISIPNLRKIAKEIGKDHSLAGRLWSSGIHEARILACLIDDPRMVTRGQLDRWVKDIDSWDVCDQCCSNLFDKTVFAYQKAVEWSGRSEEFVKRAGFVLMATLAVHDKGAEDSQFIPFFQIIIREAEDERNFVKKAVNWALRQIGKRNRALNKVAIQAGEEIQKVDSKAARWIASDALRELTSDKIQQRLCR
jgi:3-methyladenine DNA glycosylase AlkD